MMEKEQLVAWVSMGFKGRGCLLAFLVYSSVSCPFLSFVAAIAADAVVAAVVVVAAAVAVAVGDVGSLLFVEDID